MPQKESDIDEEYPDEDRKCEVGADLVPETPEYDLDLDGQHEEDKYEYETLIIVPEVLVIFFMRIDAGKNGKQCDKARHNKGDEEESPEFRQGAVSFTGSVPVRHNAIRSCRVNCDGNSEGYNEAGNNCKPDEFHISLWELIW